MATDKPDKVVTITMQGGLPVPDQDPIVATKNNQKIKFCATFEFQITITGYSDVHYSSGGSGCAFQAKTGYFTDATQYKYTIAAQNAINDPIIDIQP
jgi:hypothetical protein